MKERKKEIEMILNVTQLPNLKRKAKANKTVWSISDVTQLPNRYVQIKTYSKWPFGFIFLFHPINSVGHELQNMKKIA